MVAFRDRPGNEFELEALPVHHKSPREVGALEYEPRASRSPGAFDNGSLVGVSRNTLVRDIQRYGNNKTEETDDTSQQ